MVNVGFIGKGVEKINIAREYGNQCEITATGRDKILPAIQIVYQLIEDCCRYLLRCPFGIVLDVIRSVDSRHEQKNRTILGQTT